MAKQIKGTEFECPHCESELFGQVTGEKGKEDFVVTVRKVGKKLADGSSGDDTTESSVDSGLLEFLGGQTEEKKDG